ncbi:MAG: hypothetical protein ACKVP0_12785 [Pirellulaceae bacterium]
MRLRSLLHVVFLANLGTLCANIVSSAEPTLANLNIRGLQLGGMTQLVVSGDEFGTAPKLLLPFAAKQELQPGGTNNAATFNVTPEGEIQPGYYQVRVAAAGGVSLPLVIGVDKLPQVVFGPDVAQLPIALHGSVGGSAVSEMKLNGKAGQKIQIEVEAQRFGSKLRPVLHLYNAKKKQIAWSWNQPSLAGDTRLEAVLPEDGQYTVALHDLEYAPPGPSHFRLKIGEWAYVDQVFPVAVTKGQPIGLELLGATPIPRLDLPAVAAAGIQPLTLPAGPIWSGPRPYATVSNFAEVVELPPAAAPQVLPAGAVGVSGKLLAPQEEDRYQIPVTPGSKLRMEVFAERLGSPLDVALVVRNEKGDLLARTEDGTGTTDPNLEYAIPEGVNIVMAGVVDATARGGPRGLYRLTAEQISQAIVKNEFRLTMTTQRVSLPTGGRFVVPVFAERDGYQGSIDIVTGALPAGVAAAAIQIPADSDGTLVTLQRTDAAADVLLASWKGKAAMGEERPVWIKGHPLELLQPWLASEIALAPTTAAASTFAVDFRDLPADAALLPGQKLALPVKFFRPMTDSVVRLTLLTNQPPPLTNGQPDANKALRAEAAVEVPAANVDGAISLLIPAELPRTYYDATIQAELLAADKQKVLATSFTPVRRFNVKHQLAVQIANAKLEAKLDKAAAVMVKVDGKIERREGLTGEVIVTLAGLPAGVSAPPVTIKADAVDFAIMVAVPINTKPGETKGLTLFATAADPKQPAIRIRSRDVDLTLNVTPAP